MRRDGSPYLVNERDACIQLQRVPLGHKTFSERYLQDLLHRAPDVLPVEELDASFAPLVSVGREINAIDNLYLSPSGRITIVETKLWRNPEATRQVVTQILEYATRVSTWSYEELEHQCRKALAPLPVTPERSLYEHVCAMVDDKPTEQEFVDSVTQTLRSGRFLLLVVGDGIRYGLEELLESLHTHPQKLFTFGLVELQVYDYPAAPGYRLVVPQIVAHSTEIVRAVVRVETTGQAQVNVNMETESEKTDLPRKRRTLTEDEFFSKLPDEDDVRDAVGLILEGAVERGAMLQFRKGSVSVRLADPKGSKQRFTLFVVMVTGQVYTAWLPDQLRRTGFDAGIGTGWVESLAKLFADVSVSGQDGAGLSRLLDVREIVDQLCYSARFLTAFSTFDANCMAV